MIRWIKAPDTAVPVNLFSHYAGRCCYSLYPWLLLQCSSEWLKYVFISRILDGSGAIQYQRLSNVGSKRLVAHKAHLLKNDNGACYQDNGCTKLRNDQSFSKGQSAGGIFKQTFQNFHRLVTR